MEIIDIPVLNQIPVPAPYDANTREIADYLMTMLIQRQPAMLHAEYQKGDGRWFIRTAQKDECIAESKDLGEFRAVLARFGAHFMDLQLYGGHTWRQLTQQKQKFACRFFMSNDNATGHWIRVYAHEITT